MITSKELQYVDTRANRIPMPGYDYSMKVFEELKDCYESFKLKYYNKEYNMIFSNGEELKLEILDKNLCHMLGIDFSNIRGEYFNNYRKNILGVESNDFTSYELLEILLENADKVAKYDNSNNCEKAINYYKSGIKCEIFKKLSDFAQFNFAAINYDPNDGKYEYEKQKLLFVPSNESVCPYFMMGIRETEENHNYIVNTLLAAQEPKRYFENQEVIIPTQILISDNDNLRKIQATPEEKIKLLTMYKNIINEYQIPNRLNIYGDYESILNDLFIIESQKIKKLSI